jgi:hypothetical protein
MTHDDRGRPPRDEDESGPVDLTAMFGGRRSTAEWEALAARIERAAAPELARRAARSGIRVGGSLLDGIAAAVARFAAPALVAAAAAIVIAVGATRQSDASSSDGAVGVVASAESLSEETVRQALGAAPTAWAADSGDFGTDELVRALYDADGDQE